MLIVNQEEINHESMYYTLNQRSDKKKNWENFKKEDLLFKDHQLLLKNVKHDLLLNISI